MAARSAARRVLRRVEAEGAYASLALDAELGTRRLEDRDRRLATELVYGVLRHRSRLDRALAAMTDRGLDRTPPLVRILLEVAAYQILFLDRVPAHAAVNDAVGAARRREDEARSPARGDEARRRGQDVLERAGDLLARQRPIGARRRAAGRRVVERRVGDDEVERRRPQGQRPGAREIAGDHDLTTQAIYGIVRDRRNDACAAPAG